MSKQLDAVQDLIHRIADGTIPDERPENLKAITAAAPTCEFYNRFFFCWVQEMTPTPKVIVETGTDRGRSGAHLAAGCPTAKVVSIDIDKVCSGHLDAFGFPNVVTVTGDSVAEAIRFGAGEIDVLFIDSLHEYGHVRRELDAYVPRVRKGGLVFMDDIHLGAGMERVWNEIGHPKREISDLHFTGFGVFEA
ncbi:MAG: class I SAM-dependent methyltransferase [Gammaproteobacteria bacterium]|nr:class I SAM-dependent methyltransferase [Gammaproteobacteria bacterium]